MMLFLARIVGCVFVFLGILCLKIAVQKISFLEKWRRSGVEPTKNFSRPFFLLLASVCIYGGLKLIFLSA